MNCTRPSCREPISPCPEKHDVRTCWYSACTGWIHTSGYHACEDAQGEATPAGAP